MLTEKNLPAEFVKLCRTITAKRPKTVIDHLLKHGQITTEELNNDVVIQVADQGSGIPAEEMNHVFDRFYRARNTRTTTAGNGLGLYLAKYFVELHNGRIEVESELDKGSTFSVRLPMDLNPEAEVNERQGVMYV